MNTLELESLAISLVPTNRMRVWYINRGYPLCNHKCCYWYIKMLAIIEIVLTSCHCIRWWEIYLNSIYTSNYIYFSSWLWPLYMWPTSLAQSLLPLIINITNNQSIYFNFILEDCVLVFVKTKISKYCLFLRIQS